MGSDAPEGASTPIGPPKLVSEKAAQSNWREAWDALTKGTAEQRGQLFKKSIADRLAEANAEISETFSHARRKAGSFGACRWLLIVATVAGAGLIVYSAFESASSEKAFPSE